MAIDLFAGIPVNDYAAALTWYERLLGSPPAFFPNDVEAVWELGEHRYLYIEHLPEHAGHAMHTVFVDDFDARLAQIADRGLEPAKRETYSNGVRKAIFRDPDGNELGFGGPPQSPEPEDQRP
jgi:catechol 2,3-dioxygenase-like lactoylglutathione lyase family enzyme